MKSNNADVATVLALEKPAKAFLEAIDQTWPAIERLEKAKYAGMDEVVTQFQVYDLVEGPERLVAVLKALRNAQGSSGAFDYLWFVKHFGQTVGETAREILDMDDDDAHMQRVESLRQYAATVAR